MGVSSTELAMPRRYGCRLCGPVSHCERRCIGVAIAERMRAAEPALTALGALRQLAIGRVTSASRRSRDRDRMRLQELAAARGGRAAQACGDAGGLARGAERDVLAGLGHLDGDAEHLRRDRAAPPRTARRRR